MKCPVFVVYLFLSIANIVYCGNALAIASSISDSAMPIEHSDILSKETAQIVADIISNANLSVNNDATTIMQPDVIKLTPEKAKAFFLAMLQASKTKDYIVSYLLMRRNQLQLFRLRHANIENKQYNHLINLGGAPLNIIQFDDQISYFEPMGAPYTIKNHVIVDYIPTIINVDFDYFIKYYDLIPLGDGREYGRPSDVILASSKDGTRYTYRLWLDKESHMLLRSDLVNRDGSILEQYNVTNFKPDSDAQAYFLELSKNIKKSSPEMTYTSVKPATLNWSAYWLPQGFKMLNATRHPLATIDGKTQIVESQIYGDGLFTFSIYIAPIDKNTHANILSFQGNKSYVNQLLPDNKREVIVIGDIPFETAKHIANSIRFIEKK